jgi:hypothetical protein
MYDEMVKNGELDEPPLDLDPVESDDAPRKGLPKLSKLVTGRGGVLLRKDVRKVDQSANLSVAFNLSGVFPAPPALPAAPEALAVPSAATVAALWSPGPEAAARSTPARMRRANASLPGQQTPAPAAAAKPTAPPAETVAEASGSAMISLAKQEEQEDVGDEAFRRVFAALDGADPDRDQPKDSLQNPVLWGAD